ncbi:MAG: helix-turn-helix domain-containing protein [Protaetiibacter sp.]
MTQPPSRGVLYPARLPTFTRMPPSPAEAPLVVHFWIPEWNVEPGRVSRQHVIGYPALNLVVTDGEAMVSGPTTRRSHRDLRGRGWAVGALLRPAAVPAIAGDPLALRDTQTLIDAHELVAAVSTQMGSETSERVARACRALGEWIVERVGDPSPEALLANELARVIDSDPAVLQLADIATRLNVSERTVTRLARRFVGVTPAAMIRRRRLQEAAEQLRADPGTPLAEVAARHGYADQSHLSRDFRAVLGFTPTGYRTDAAATSAASVQHPPFRGL